MDFELTQEQKQLQSQARELVSREVAPLADEYDRIMDPMPEKVAKGFFKKLQPLGYVSGMVPLHPSGGISPLSYGIILEELAKAYGSLALMEMALHVSGPLSLYKYGTESQKKAYLPGLISGEQVACYGITERYVGSGAKGVVTTATLNGNEFIVEGNKAWITNGSVADICILVAETKRGKPKPDICRFIVDRTQSPYKTSELPRMGLRSCPTSLILFENCHVPADNLFGEAGAGYKETLDFFLLPRLGVATVSLGVAQAALEASTKYVQQRKQFNRPIGTFQLVQEMLADMAIEVDAARLLTHRGFDMFGKGRPCAKETSMSKGYSTQAAVRVTSKAIEIHGALGVSEEYPVERYFRDARSLTIPDGTIQIQKLIIGRELSGLRAFV